jgi:Protein of unknown function (DUF4238)
MNSTPKTQSKKHHYVPQFLLKNWRDANGMINAFDKKSRAKWRQSERELGHENGLYKLRKNDGTTANMEPMMAKVDDWGSPAIHELIRTEAVSSLDNGQRTELSYFIGAMLLRTPSTRKRMLEMNREMVAKFGPDVELGESDEKLGDFDETGAHNSTIQMIAQSTPEFAEHIREKVWLLAKYTADSPFYISDNPVVLHNSVKQPPAGNLGILSPGIEIYLPLSPSLCLMMLCPKIVNIAKEQLGTGIKKSYWTDTPVQFERENVLHVNSLQVIRSERFIFSSSEDFSLADEMLKSYPHLSDGSGLRFLLN